MHNPSDLGPQQCEITVCANCRNLATKRRDLYADAFWKTGLILQIIKDVHGKRFNSIEKVGLSVSVINNGLLIMKDVGNRHDKYSISSAYPIINIDFPSGIPTFDRYRITGQIRKNISTISSCLTFPYVKNSSIKHIIFPAIVNSVQLSIAVNEHIKPIIMTLDKMCPTVFWFDTHKYSNTSCLEGVTVKIKEAMLSSCPHNSTNERGLFATTIYNLTEILNILFQAGFKTCYLSIEMHRQNDFNDSCEIQLNRMSSDCHKKKSQKNRMFIGGSQEKFYKCSGESECIFIRKHNKLYRYVSYCI